MLDVLKHLANIHSWFNMDLKVLLVLVLCALSIEGFVSKHRYVLRSPNEDRTSIDDDWWRTGIFYQIYPRSFKDTDGDGYGDLQGIISKLNHLKDMGVTAAWLSPIYKSPGVDQGYDISDFKDIDPLFGTLEDLRELVAKAHKLGIKIIMDFVPNHTSDQHEWFQKSVNNDPTYKDYYIWQDSIPNNWLSRFDGSAWEFNPTRNQYYLHQFTTAQPDLNFRNPAVFDAIADTLHYWLDFGIDGFRIDAVPYLFEDRDLKDEPRSGNPGVGPNQETYLKHIYTRDLDENYYMIYQIRELLDKFNANNATYSRIMMTESYTPTIDQTIAYYGNSTNEGAQFSFNFYFLLSVSDKFTIDEIITTINMWLSHLPKKYVSNWLLGNHDQNRVATRFGVENVDAFNMLAAFLPGIQVVYNGEEIGMENGEVTCEQGFDPNAIKNCSTFAQLSRDFERTPFHWDDSPNAGFTTGDHPWLPVSRKYKTNNLRAQKVKGVRSHYKVFRSMVKFRKNFKNITKDFMNVIKVSDNVLEIVRTTDKSEYFYVFNAGNKPETVSLFTNGVNLKVLVTDMNSQLSKGDVIPQKVTLNPHECLILEGHKVKSSGTN